MEQNLTPVKKDEAPKKERQGVSSAFIERVIAAQKLQHEEKSS